MKPEIILQRTNLELKLRLYSFLMNNKERFLSRFIPDPLSMLIVTNIPRYHKLEVLLMATTLLRFSDCKKLDKLLFLGNEKQIIMQGKTKNPIEVPSLFLSTTPDKMPSFPALDIFVDSYDKFHYSLVNAIPRWLSAELKTQRIITHIFRFLRASYMYIQHKDFYLSSIYLGHKDPESIRSYVPPELLNLYSTYLSKG
jgi:hypothetical protein